jgi:hypothetical protein
MSTEIELLNVDCAALLESSGALRMPTTVRAEPSVLAPCSLFSVDAAVFPVGSTLPRTRTARNTRSVHEVSFLYSVFPK